MPSSWFPTKSLAKMPRPSDRDQADTILRTVRHMKDVHGKGAMAIYLEYLKWCEKTRETVDIGSDETVRTWLNGKHRPHRAGSFYDFALTQLDTPDPKSAIGMLAGAINELFPSGELAAPSKLSRFVGEYEMIRRLWTPAGSDDCIRCKAWFQLEHGVVVYREEESFQSDYDVDERYQGYTFMFGSSFWILAHEENQKSLKFITIHDCAPTVTASSRTFDFCKGNLIAVSGKGPNVSHRFVLKRKRGNPRWGTVKKRDALLLFDKSTTDYLYSDNDIL